jgi:hypothetical protein
MIGDGRTPAVQTSVRQGTSSPVDSVVCFR